MPAVSVANIRQSYTYKMAAKTCWHRHGTKLRHCCSYVQDGPKKLHTKRTAIIRSNLNRFLKFFYWKIGSTFAVKYLLMIPPHLARVATLPGET